MKKKTKRLFFLAGAAGCTMGASHLAAAGNFGVFYRSRECLESYGVRT